jgi:hypothetical protein
MRTHLFQLAAFIVFAATIPSGVLAADREDTTTATVTRIRYDGSVFMKMVEITNALPQVESKDAREHVNLNILVSGLIHLQVVEGPGHAVLHISAFKIPFSHIYVLDKLLYDDQGNFPTTHDSNPFCEAMPIDQPVFSLMDFVAVVPGEVKDGEVTVEAEGSRPGEAEQDTGLTLTVKEDHLVVVRKRVLDSLVFCLYRKDQWDDGQYDVEWLRFPLTPTYARVKSHDKSELRIVDSGSLFTLFYFVNLHHVKPEPTQIEVLGSLLGTVYQGETSANHKRWAFLDVPFVSAVVEAKTEDRHAVTLLGTGSFESALDDRPKGPSLALWYQEERADRAVYEFLRVPLIGPVAAHWSESGDTHWGVFPRLMFWEKFPY